MVLLDKKQKENPKLEGSSFFRTENLNSTNNNATSREEPRCCEVEWIKEGQGRPGGTLAWDSFSKCAVQSEKQNCNWRLVQRKNKQS